ncbi:MAG: transcription termination/antitermination NusG family protein [Verrucomicrobiota bacterium]
MKAKPKSEHLAAAFLRRALSLEAFCPRIRYEKSTVRGKRWFAEAMFPGYLFARFDLAESRRAVQYGQGVAGLVHFGDEIPELSDYDIDYLRSELGEKDLVELPTHFEEGEEVQITDGVFLGIQVLITQVLPSHERLRVLMEWLGEEREVEVDFDKVSRVDHPAERISFLAGKER